MNQENRSNLLRWIVVATVALFVMGGAVFGILQVVGEEDPARLTSAANVAVEPVLNARAPDFTLQTTSGDVVGLSDFLGQPVLINFWATWCGPCRIEMPAIQDRYLGFKDDGLVVLAVNFDESQEAVTAYGEELGLTFPLLLDPGGEIQKRYRNRSYPTSFFVDSEGVIRAHHIGVMTENQLDENLARIGLGR